MTEQLTRRDALRAGGLAGLAALAGCAGGDGTTTSTRATTTSSTTVTSTGTSTTTQAKESEGPSEFVGVDGRHFTLDGEPWFFNGGHYTRFPFQADRGAIREILRDAAEANVNVLRTRIGCAGRGPAANVAGEYCIQPEAGEVNEQALQLLDYAIAESKQYGIRFVIWFANNWRLAGNGIAQYVAWANDEPLPDDGGSEAGQQFRDRFYADEGAKQLYREFVEHVLTRENTYTGVEYRNDPSILLWELVNEGKALEENRAAFLEWHREMAGFVSELAPDQLVGTGGQGYYTELPAWADEADRDWVNAGTGMDYVADNSIDDIDACSFHMYPDDIHGHWDLTDEQTRRWIRGHVLDAHERVGKPAYCGEWAYGAQRDAENAAEQLERRNRKYEQYFQWFDEYDLDGSAVYEFVDGDPHPYPHDNGIYCPEDEQTCSLIAEYGETVAEKSGGGS